MEDRISPVQRHGDLTHNIEKNNSEQESVLNVSHSLSNSQENGNRYYLNIEQNIQHFYQMILQSMKLMV